MDVKKNDFFILRNCSKKFFEIGENRIILAVKIQQVFE